MARRPGEASLRCLPLLVLSLSLAFAFSCGGNKRDLLITVYDDQNNPVPKVQITQVGRSGILGETGKNGERKVQVLKRKGERVQLVLTSPKNENGDFIYLFDYPGNTVEVSQDDVEAGWIKVWARPASTPEDVSSQADTLATLRIESTPTGALVLVNGIERGTTPGSITGLRRGRTEITLRLQGYHPYEQDLALAAGVNPWSAVLKPMEIVTASLRVESDPTDAEIDIDQRPTGKRTPHTFEGLSSGEHRVRISKGGFREFASRIRLTPGEEAMVSAPLQPLRGETPGSEGSPPAVDQSETGSKVSYMINTRPSWAAVYVDADTSIDHNEMGGFTMSLSPGRHRFQVVNEDRGINITLYYNVRSDDPASGLILDFQKQKVIPVKNK